MQLLRFNSWLKKSLHEQRKSQRIDYSKWSGANQYNWTEDDEPVVQTNEDLSGSDKKNKILLLKKLLSNFDKYYHYSDDSRVYRKGKEQQDEIEKLVKEIGKDGLKIYRNYISTKESMETGTDGNLFSNFQFFPPTPPLSTEEKHQKRTMIYGKLYKGE